MILQDNSEYEGLASSANGSSGTIPIDTCAGWILLALRDLGTSASHLSCTCVHIFCMLVTGLRIWDGCMREAPITKGRGKMEK